MSDDLEAKVRAFFEQRPGKPDPDDMLPAEQALREAVGMMPFRADYNRQELLDLCQRAVVPHNQWSNRDSAGAQETVGKAWALLCAGVPFEVLTDPSSSCCTDADIVWVRFKLRGFDWFEGARCTNQAAMMRGAEMEVFKPDDRDELLEEWTAYLPTSKRLAANPDRDWY